MDQAETDDWASEKAPTWLVVVSTTSSLIALLVSLLLRYWLTSIGWLAASSLGLGWLSERAEKGRD